MSSGTTNNVSVVASASNATSMAVVHVERPPVYCVPVDEYIVNGMGEGFVIDDALSDRAIWGSQPNSPVSLGALQTREDIARFVKSNYPPGIALEDILRHLITRLEEEEQRSRSRGGLVKKLADQLITSRSIHAQQQIESDETRQMLYQAVGLMDFFRNSLDDQSLMELVSRLQRQVKDLEKVAQCFKHINDDLCTINDTVTTSAVRALRGSPLNVMPTIRQVVSNILLELAKLGDACIAKGMPFPESLGMATEWCYELERFLRQVEAFSRKISGDSSEEGLERSGLLRLLRTEIVSLHDALSKSNSFPRTPVAPFRTLVTPAAKCICAPADSAFYDSKRPSKSIPKSGSSKAVKKPRVSV
ncbi:hypothetical protein PQX77_018113 [Marasmius sp. AFHP31]|nr:hypothetical protein PQX77_018113 [Marasmius sp. AFHP31]